MLASRYSPAIARRLRDFQIFIGERQHHRRFCRGSLVGPQCHEERCREIFALEQSKWAW